MNELAALRRIALSSSAACARLARAGGGTDFGILAALNSKDALKAALATASRITIADVNRLVEPLITSTEPEKSPEPNNADLEHVRFMSTHG